MSNRSRSFARRKAQNDHKAQVHQAKTERKNAVKKNGTAAQTAPEMETEVRKFTEAEARVFQKKAQVYREAADDLNEFVTFLKEQHDVDPKDGWDLGNLAFVRQVPKTNVPTATTASRAKSPKPTKPASNGKRPKTPPDSTAPNDPTEDEGQPAAKAT
jgi:hypothetical protein